MLEKVRDRARHDMVEFIHKLGALPPGILEDVVGQVEQRDLSVNVWCSGKLVLPQLNNFLCILQQDSERRRC